jgi:hypothetical protein
MNEDKLLGYGECPDCQWNGETGCNVERGSKICLLNKKPKVVENDEMEDLTKMTDEELSVHEKNVMLLLNEEKERRKKTKLEIQRTKNLKIIKFLKKNPEFLELIEHSRTSCSDENPCNGSTGLSTSRIRCQKCLLLDILKHEDESYEIDFSIDIYKSENVI